jgi:IS5 family transposase
LDDPRFLEPFRPFFDPRVGRPSIPVETCLRLMYLRFRYHLGFEALCVEVADSLSWRRCPARVQAPHPTKLMKITTRCGAEVVAELNDALLAKADERKLLRLDRVWADTTVEANVAYPADVQMLPAAEGCGVCPIWMRTLKALAVRRIVNAIKRGKHAEP